MPAKKLNKTVLQLTDGNLHAVISVGEGREVGHKQVDGEDDGKPLYLKRI
jgi:hypothetical protein